MASRKSFSAAKSPVQQAIPRGGLMDQLRQLQSGLLQPRQGQFLDLTGSDDFHAAMNIVARVKRQFASLPSGLRWDCMNDPRQMQSLLRSAQEGDEVSVALLKRYGVEWKRPLEPVAPEPPVMSSEQLDLVRAALRPDPEAQTRRSER